MENKRTKVSIGLPTYNRSNTLRRAVASVLGQDYDNFELLISDDASPDDTEAICRAFARADTRIRYTRQPSNTGLTANNNFVLENSGGEFFMWLSDDDWLEPNYLSACVAELEAHPQYVSARGVSRYIDGERIYLDEEPDLIHETGAERVLAYLAKVGHNATLYGLMRRDRLERLRMRNAIGGDWMFVAGLAFIGRIKLLKHAQINRALGGSSEGAQKLARTLRLPSHHALNPFLTLSISVYKEIAWRSPVYDSLPSSQRRKLGVQAFRVIWSTRSWPFAKQRLRDYASLVRIAITSPQKVWKRLRGSGN